MRDAASLLMRSQEGNNNLAFAAQLALEPPPNFHERKGFSKVAPEFDKVQPRGM